MKSFCMFARFLFPLPERFGLLSFFLFSATGCGEEPTNEILMVSEQTQMNESFINDSIERIKI